MRLAGVRAGQGDPWPEVTLSLGEDLVATVTGSDPDGGMGRARVSVEVRFSCRDPRTGRRWSVPYARHHPPPAVERVKITPGTEVRTRLVRRARVSLTPARCDGAELESASGMAWADVTNASGLDATSSHIRFRAP